MAFATAVLALSTSEAIIDVFKIKTQCKNTGLVKRSHEKIFS
jgi:hypothetical protein